MTCLQFEVRVQNKHAERSMHHESGKDLPKMVEVDSTQRVTTRGTRSPRSITPELEETMRLPSQATERTQAPPMHA